MKRYQYGYTAAELMVLVWIVIVLVGFVGWGMNIYKISQVCCDVSGMLVIRVVGIFVAPLGAVLGFL